MAPVVAHNLSIPDSTALNGVSLHHRVNALSGEVTEFLVQPAEVTFSYFSEELEGTTSAVDAALKPQDVERVEVYVDTDMISAGTGLDELPDPADIIQVIKDWFMQIWSNLSFPFSAVSDFFQRTWAWLADHIGIVAGQVEEFVKEHPKEIGITVGALFLAVAVLVFLGPAILAIIGFGISGPIAGTLVALLQSVAMTGVLLSSNVLVFAAVALVVGLGLILYFSLHG